MIKIAPDLSTATSIKLYTTWVFSLTITTKNKAYSNKKRYYLFAYSAKITIEGKAREKRVTEAFARLENDLLVKQR